LSSRATVLLICIWQVGMTADAIPAIMNTITTAKIIHRVMLFLLIVPPLSLLLEIVSPHMGKDYILSPPQQASLRGRLSACHPISLLL
jgi:hypothetical protein